MGLLKFAEKIREIREKKFLTRAVVSEKLSVSFMTIARLEHGLVQPSALVVAKLFAALGVECPESDTLLRLLAEPDPEGFTLPKREEYRSKSRKRPTKRKRESEQKTGEK